MRIKKLSNKARIPVIDGPSIGFYCSDIQTYVGKDGRPIIVYKSDIEIEIPEGKIGIVYQSNKPEIRSLEYAGGTKILYPGFIGEFTASFKTNTDAIPFIYEGGEIFSSLILVDKVDVILEEIEEPAADPEPTEQIDEVL